MKFSLHLITLLICLSCSKEESGCDLTGTWAMVERIKGQPDNLGVELILNSNGAMSFGGRTGYHYALEEDCKTLLYWTVKDLPFKHRLPIVSNDGNYMTLDMDSLNGGHGLGIWGKLEFKKLK